MKVYSVWKAVRTMVGVLRICALHKSAPRLGSVVSEHGLCGGAGRGPRRWLRCQLRREAVEEVVRVLRALGLRAVRVVFLRHVEVARVRVAHEVGHERRALCAQVGPVDAVEEGVGDDRFESGTDLRVAQQPFDHVLGSFAQGVLSPLRREVQVLPPLDDLVACLHHVVGVEWRIPAQHLIENDADAPPVAVHAVALLHQHLGCYVPRRADGCPEHLPVSHVLPRLALVLVALVRLDRRRVGNFALHHLLEGDLVDVYLLAEPEICELDVSVPVKEDVVRLDVAVGVPHPMDRMHSKDQLGHVELRHLLPKDIVGDEPRHQVAARQKLHHQIQMVLVLEGVVQVCDPRVFFLLLQVVRLHKHVAFRPHVRHLVAVHHVLLVQTFYRHHLVRFVNPAAQADFTEGTAPDHAHNLEVPQRHLLLPRLLVPCAEPLAVRRHFAVVAGDMAACNASLFSCNVAHGDFVFALQRHMYTTPGHTCRGCCANEVQIL
eukprot:Rhum_TRINITY_DN14714_c3_g2::Rhum_TRINITY_DN14714_c3_g2_i1::g.113320::m.113320